MSMTWMRSRQNTTGARQEENVEMTNPAEVKAMLAQLVTQLRAAQEAKRMQEASREPTAEEIQAGISRTMAEVVRDAHTNPQRLIPAEQMQRENVKPAG